MIQSQFSFFPSPLLPPIQARKITHKSIFSFFSCFSRAKAGGKREFICELEEGIPALLSTGEFQKKIEADSRFPSFHRRHSKKPLGGNGKKCEKKLFFLDLSPTTTVAVLQSNSKLPPINLSRRRGLSPSAINRAF